MSLDLTTTGSLKDKALRERARLLYYGNILPEVIAHTFKIDIDELNYLIMGPDGRGTNVQCWYRQKKELTPTSIVAFIADKVNVLENTSGLAHEILTTNLQRIRKQQMADDEIVYSVKEMESIAKIFIEMDKVTRLEKGEATEITRKVGLTPKELMGVFAKDKFNIESLENPEPMEADYREIN